MDNALLKLSTCCKQNFFICVGKQNIIHIMHNTNLWELISNILYSLSRFSTFIIYLSTPMVSYSSAVYIMLSSSFKPHVGCVICCIPCPGNNISWVPPTLFVHTWKEAWRLRNDRKKKNKDTKEKTETWDRVSRATSEYWVHPHLFLIGFIYSNSKRRGKTEDTFTKMKGTK